MHKTTRSYYTIVELLVVVVIVGILLSVSMSGINRMLGRQGLTGAVRTMSSQLALTRSYAVVKNKYIALLMPGAAAYTENFDTPLLQPYLYTKVRVCLVKNFDATTSPITPTAEFDSWIDGNEWETMPSGVVASLDTVVGMAQVTDIAFDGNSNLASPAIIFKPSGALAGVGGGSSTISLFMGKYVPLRGLIYGTKSGQRFGWDITINPYTGRASYEKQSN